MKLFNVVVSGIHWKDAPHYVDAYIESAEHEDGTPLSNEELEGIPSDTVYAYTLKMVGIPDCFFYPDRRRR